MAFHIAKDAEPILIGVLTNSDADFKTLVATYKDAEKETYLYVLADMLGFFFRPLLIIFLFRFFLSRFWHSSSLEFQMHL